MAFTAFSELNSVQKLVWSRRTWSAARDMMFIDKFTGGDSAVIQLVNELTETEKGAQCMMQLVADLVGDGVVGDSEREGNEESMKNYEQIINVDLISHGVRNKGKMEAQKTVIEFRNTGRNRLAYWLANRVDQLAFLTLSGIGYNFQNNGAPRVNSPFPTLSFAAQVSAPTSKRALMYDGTSLQVSATGSIASTYVLSYKAIVDLVAYAKTHYVKPLVSGGKEYYCLFVQPGTLASLKKDADYQRAVVGVATKSGTDSPWFQGGTVTIDGLVIHEHRLVYNTKGAASGSKWGAASAIDGTRSLLCGAQALGMADIGSPSWVEKMFQYDSQPGINVDKMFGFVKPVFFSIYDGSSQDFGVITLDTFLQ